MSDLLISPATRPLNAEVTLPGSKSLTLRALATAAVADGESTLHGALFSDDTHAMLDSLHRLGVRIISDPASSSIHVQGCAGHIPLSDGNLDCGLSGLTLRFLTAILATQAGEYKLDGVPRMRQRPVGDLVDALRRLGGIIAYEDQEGFPPVRVEGYGLRGGEVTFDSPPSSQLVSALLLAAPLCRADVLVRVEGKLVSRPYVDMTLQVMQAFGVSVVEDGLSWIVPAPQRYVGTHYDIEPDASNASYFLAAAAAVGGRVTVRGIGTSSVQGDAAFADVLGKMGCRVIPETDRTTVERAPGMPLRGVDVDLNDMPDMAQTLAALALLAEGPTTIHNVANLRVKETDRLAAVTAECRKFGAEVQERDDGWTITPPEKGALHPASVSTYNDHRMAMSFAVVGLAVPGTVIENPECVAKTFPDFFQRFCQLTTKP